MKKSLIQTLLNFVYPPLCLYCLNKKENPKFLFCSACQCFLEPIANEMRCKGCGNPFKGVGVCGNCRENRWWEAHLIPLYEKTPQLEKLIAETVYTHWIRERTASILSDYLPKGAANWRPLKKKEDPLAKRVCQKMQQEVVGPYAPTHLFSTKRGDLNEVHQLAKGLKEKGALSVSLFYMI